VDSPVKPLGGGREANGIPPDDNGTVVVENRKPQPPKEQRAGWEDNNGTVWAGRQRRRPEGQRAGWEVGYAVSADELLGRWPLALPADPDVASVLYEGLLPGGPPDGGPGCRDREAGPVAAEPSPGRMVWRDTLLQSLSTAPGEGDGALSGLPQVGDEVFGFRLLRELGHGAFARVFLARRGGSASRAVVLKVSAIAGSEPDTLAQLRHAHIVPMQEVYEDVRAGLRAISMPYFGGATLSHLLYHLWDGDCVPVHGEEFVQALARVEAPPPAAPPAGPTARERLGASSYVRAAAWVVARLAEGLQHAHERGVLHRDVKPSNILIGGDGQPYLLDFNVSQEVGGDPAEAPLGGTVSYMAPEHLRALVAWTDSPARQVDRRSDIYSLGLVLYEMLAGQKPFEQTGSYAVPGLRIQAMALERSKTTPSLRARRPDVPWGLESILRKCLAPDPARRYQQAVHLAEDLQRFLDDEPLKYAPELSRVERVRKWLRRRFGKLFAGR